MLVVVSEHEHDALRSGDEGIIHVIMESARKDVFFRNARRATEYAMGGIPVARCIKQVQFSPDCSFHAMLVVRWPKKNPTNTRPKKPHDVPTGSLNT